MERLWLRIQAPFSAYRPMQAGSLRATLPVMSYSAAWGLVLNLAGIETRQGLDRAVTGVDPSAPSLRLVVGLPYAPPTTGSLFQQAHGYPVGASGKELQVLAKGAKYWIAPVRREVLVGLDVVVGIECDASIAGRVRDGVEGRGNWRRYGLPFAGDNNLLFDRIEPITSPPACRWYTPVDLKAKPRQGATRLSRSIDRADSSRSVNELVAPQSESERTVEPPANAWIWTPREPATVSAP